MSLPDRFLELEGVDDDGLPVELQRLTHRSNHLGAECLSYAVQRVGECMTGAVFRRVWPQTPEQLVAGDGCGSGERDGRDQRDPLGVGGRE